MTKKMVTKNENSNQLLKTILLTLTFVIQLEIQVAVLVFAFEWETHPLYKLDKSKSANRHGKHFKIGRTKM